MLNCTQIKFILYWHCTVLFCASDHKKQLLETSAIVNSQHLMVLCPLWCGDQSDFGDVLLLHQDSLRFVFKGGSSFSMVQNFSFVYIY